MLCADQQHVICEWLNI